MLDWAGHRGLTRVEGDVLVENAAMLDMVRDLGGALGPIDAENHAVRVNFEIGVRG